MLLISLKRSLQIYLPVWLSAKLSTITTWMWNPTRSPGPWCQVSGADLCERWKGQKENKPPQTLALQLYYIHGNTESKYAPNFDKIMLYLVRASVRILKIHETYITNISSKQAMTSTQCCFVEVLNAYRRPIRSTNSQWLREGLKN